MAMSDTSTPGVTYLVAGWVQQNPVAGEVAVGAGVDGKLWQGGSGPCLPPGSGITEHWFIREESKKNGTEQSDN